MEENEKELDEIERQTRESLNSAIHLKAAERMQASLTDFHQNLEAHPYVRTLERKESKKMPVWRLGLRYASGAALICLVVASFSETGREQIAKAVYRSYANVDSRIRMQMRGETGAYNRIAGMEDAMPAPDLSNAKFGYLLGLTADGQRAVFEVSLLQVVPMPADAEDREKTVPIAKYALWEVDLETGRVNAIAPQNVLDSLYQMERGPEGRLKGLLFLIRPKSLRLAANALFSGGRADQLWFWDTKNKAVLIADGGIAGRWFALSPDASKLFFHRASWSGMQTVIRDLSTGKEIEWRKDGPGQGNDRKKKEHAIAIGWTQDSQRVVTMTQRNVKDRVPVCRYSVVSLDGEKVHDNLDVSDARGYLGDPTFIGGNRFWVETRPKDKWIEPDKDTTEIYSVEPLKRVAAAPGAVMSSSSDGAKLIVEKIGKKGAFLPEVSVVDTASGKVSELNLKKLTPPIRMIGPSTWTVPMNGACSPGSRFLNVQPDMLRGQKIEFALLDLGALSIGKVFKDFYPNSAAWSPDGRRIAARAIEKKGEDFRSGFVLDVESGKIQRFDLPYALPVAWLDNDRALWPVRWGSEDVAQKKPMQIAITNCATGEAKTIDLAF